MEEQTIVVILISLSLKDYKFTDYSLNVGQLSEELNLKL